MANRVLTLFSGVALLGLLFGCVKEDFDKTPALENTATWKKTVTIAQLNALYVDKAGVVDKMANSAFWDAILAQGVADSSVVFEAFVISSDSAGNFYETVTLMDETGGLELKINTSELYLKYSLKPGQKVLVRVNRLALDKYNGVYQLGLPITDVYNGSNTIKADKIAPGNVAHHVQLSGCRESLSPIELKLSEITDAHVSRLVTIDSVQFWNPHTTYSVEGENTNRILMDKHGNQIAMRNSGYAKFKNEPLPSGSGTVTGVLSTYGATRQLYIRDLNDVQLTRPRFGEAAPVANTTIRQLKNMCTADSVKIGGEIFIGGVVVANDEGGNIYQKLSIQDETGAIELRVFSSMLYPDFPVGTKVVVSCKGLYVGKYGGVIQLGGMYFSTTSNKWLFGGLSSDKFYGSTHIVGQATPPAPEVVSIEDFSDDLIGKVIKLENVQFADVEMGKSYSESSSSATNRILVSRAGVRTVVRNSRYANFATALLPPGSGSVTAVLGKFNSDYQLYIQTLAGVQLNQPRFEIQYPAVNTTIAGLKALYTSGTMQITQDVIVQGLIVGNDVSGNLYKQLFVADETGGIEFRVNVTGLYQTYPVGTRVIISCKEMYLGSYGGVTQLGGLHNGSFGRIEQTEFNNKVFAVATETVIPVETTIGGITDAMLGRLVRLSGVQFADADLGKTYAVPGTTTNRTLRDAGGNTIIVRTSGYANFASTELPNNSGTLTAVLGKFNSDYQLYIVQLSDVVFDQPRMP